MKRLFLAVALITVGCKEQPRSEVIPIPAKPTEPIPTKHTATIVDGPKYLASKKTAEQLEAELAQYQANSVERPGMAGQPHDDGNGIAVDPNTIPAKATTPTLDLPVHPATGGATTPYPGPPPADTLGLCFEHDGNGSVECSPEQLQQLVADSQRYWEVLPEWVRQDCKTYREPKITGCVVNIAMAWFTAHPGEPTPSWIKYWGLGGQAK
jgi:hypothetical protein